MIEILERDTDGLPQALLGEAKAFMNIDYCDKDLMIVMMLGSVIEQFEIYRGVTIFPTEYAWTVDEFSDDRVAISPEQRITPIHAWVASIPNENGDPVDVSAGYTVRRRGLHGPAYYDLVGSYGAGLGLAITSGYADAISLPKGLKGIIFQATSRLFEYRDILTVGGLQELPDWANREISGYWVPRV